MQARRVHLKVEYNKKDISADLSKYLRSFSYTDVMTGAADDISISLDDVDGLWRGDWLPEKGDTIRAALIQEGWKASDGEEEQLDLGLFEVDEIECSGFPSVVSVKGVSIPNSSALRGVYKSRSWEKAKLSIIAKDIADGAEMKLLYDTEEDPQLERAEQTEQTDLSFLMKLCTDAGLALKVTDEQIVIFDVAKYEQEEPIVTLKRTEQVVKSYTLQTKVRDVYASCKVSYREGMKKEKIEGQFERPDGKKGQVLVVNEQVASVAEAEKLAKKRLRAANQEEVSANLTVLGDIIYTAGSTVMLEDFGKFDGKYIVHQCTHSGGDSYSVDLELRRTLDGY